MKSTGLRAGEEKDRATWRVSIISHTDDPRWRDKPGGKKKTATLRLGALFTIASTHTHLFTSVFVLLGCGVVVAAVAA